MELDLHLGSMCTAVLIIGWDPATPPPPHLGSYTEGAIAAKIDDISLW
jgi:hypothetical protein